MKEFVLLSKGAKARFKEVYTPLTFLKSIKDLRPINCKIDLEEDDKYVVSFFKEYDKETLMELSESEKKYEEIGFIKKMNIDDSWDENLSDFFLNFKENTKYSCQLINYTIEDNSTAYVLKLLIY